MNPLLSAPSAALDELTDHELAQLRHCGKASRAAILHAALWECAPSLQFRIELERETAIPLLARMAPCNSFYPSKVIAALRYIDGIIPRADYGPSNPNNGERTFAFAPGVEGSEVIYLIRREFHPRNPLTDRQIAEIERAMRWAEADEVSHDVQEHSFLGPGNRTVEFCFWWD